MAQTMGIYFITASLVFLIMGCIEGMMFPLKTVMQPVLPALLHLPAAQVKPFFQDFLIKIHAHISLVGWVTTALMGILYYTAHQIKGRNRYNRLVCLTGFWSHISGILTMTVGFHLIGYFGLSAGLTYGTPEFQAVACGYKNIVGAGGFLVTCSVICFSYNILKTLWSKEL